MVTEEQYNEAILQKENAKRIINDYIHENQIKFNVRWNEYLGGEKYFSEDELIYSATARCDSCGAGLAYPNSCGIHHHWSCSAELVGDIQVKGREFHRTYHFSHYGIKSELQPSANGQTTRPKKEDGQEPKE